jgi:hypothetical protein
MTDPNFLTDSLECSAPVDARGHEIAGLLVDR